MPSEMAVVLFWACVLACAAAQGAIVRAALRRHERNIGPHRARELVWAMLPAVALAFLLGVTWASLPT